MLGHQGHPKQYQVACNPTEMSDASLQGINVIQFNQLVISVHLPNKIPRQAHITTLGIFFLDDRSIRVPHSSGLMSFNCPFSCTEVFNDPNGLGPAGRKLSTWWAVYQ